MSQTLYKIIYHPQINPILRNLNKLVSPVLAGVQLPPSGKMRLRASGKPFEIETNQTNFLTKVVFWEGLENFEYTAIFIDLIKKVESFYDIGANIGFYSVLASTLNPEIEVTSFEPAPGPLHYLKSNVALGKFKNIQIAPVALSNAEGEIDFYEIQNTKYRYLKHNLGGEGNTGSKTTERAFAKITVPCQTFDDFVEKSGKKGPQLIKIDTEGTEHLILEKAGNTLSTSKPIIICETLYDKIEGKLEDALKPYGYEFYNHTERGLEKTESIRRTMDNGVRNCFFVHPSKYDLIAPFVSA